MGDIYTNPPQSRNEAILRATIDGTEYTDPPQSRIEDLLIELKETIESGGSKIKLADVSGAAVALSFNTASLTWTDPEDIIVSGSTLAKWKGTKVLRKVGSAPEDINDGTLVVDSTVKNQYSSSGFTDTNLEYGTMYYYRWFPYTEEGMVTDGTSISCTPVRTKITTVPTQDGTLTYDGTEQTASFNDYDSDKMTVSGNTGTNAGSYTAQFTPKEGYCWDDDSLTAKDVTWTIAKATNTITASPSSISLDTTTLYQDVTLAQTGDGVLSVVSGDTDVVTVGAIENGVFRATGVDTGNTTITVSSTATENFEAGTLEISCTASFWSIVSWANGTDAEIAALIAAADRGEVDLYADAGWRVGDERTVSLSAMAASGTYDGVTWNVGESHDAQTVTLVLADGGTTSETGNTFSGTAASDIYTFVTSVKNKDGTTRTNPAFIVVIKELLYNRGYMNATKTNSGSWEGCARRAWCNGAFRSAIPSKLLNAFKQFNTNTIETYDGSTLKTSQDYFALNAEREIFQGLGSPNSNSIEYNYLKTFSYYKTAANRVKKLNGTSTAEAYWLRSPYKGQNDSFCNVSQYGSQSWVWADFIIGLSPFGCI